MNLMDNLKMLPEFLFTVGHSMQDISRDDFSLLNGAEIITPANHADKDMCPTLISRIQNNSPINPNVLVLSKHLTAVEDNAAAPSAFASVKLEDSNTIDLFPTHPTSWQQHPMNSHELAHHRLSVHHHRFDHSSNSKLLLQGSDDPLISHGANSVICHDDDHPADFAKCLLTSTNNHPPASSSTIHERVHFSSNARAVAINPQLSQEPPQQRPIKSGCSSLTKQQLKVKANLMSARNQQQQQQQQLQQKIESNAAATSSAVVPNQLIGPKQRPAAAKTKAKKPSNSIKLRFHHQALPPEYLSHYEATQGQTRPTKTPKSTNSQQRPPSKQTRNSHENVRSWLQKIAEIQRTANASKVEERQVNETTTQQQTLDANNNQAPSATTPVVIRSSNIEVGIVKTVTKDQSHKRSHYYSDLPYMGEITLDNSKPRRGRKPKKADICHLIYKNYGTILPKRRPESHDCVNIDKVDLKYRLDNNTTTKTECEDDQPLNLCLRDQATDAYSISSADDASETNSSCATPPVTTPLDFDRDSMLANNLKNSLTNLNELDNENITREKDPPSILLPQQKSSNVSDESMLNPITMYYQKLLESGVLLHNANGPIRTIQKDNQLALKIPIPSGLFLPPKREKTPASASPAPSNANSLSLEYPEQLSTPSSIKSENSSATNASSTILGTSGSQQQQAPQKRKRSAIFIPPMNIENTSNPATEVSICKFKFTGGSKPSLQEKKMLSVDAGGNYRYFSGTGDKTTRGYEYFPREMLQTAGLLPGVNCTGQKFLIDIPPPSAGLSNELLQIPESPTSSMLMTPSATTTAINGNVVTTTMSSKTPPQISPQSSTFVEISRNEVVGPDNYIEDHLECNQSSSNANRLMLARKKQALHQLRKSTQREKLEKTFKEQGFLIQTQQLESAEGATYCKFRQLKKFTRYLFRNWKDYLPDELQRNENGALLATATVNEEFGHHLGGQQKEQILTTTSSAVSENLSILENAIPIVREDHILE